MNEAETPVTPTEFSDRILAWFDRHGRTHLPWQQQPNRYRVWVSEIMLQQTQVATVIPYYQRFMGQFPSIQALAEAPLDSVLSLWSGLGYYARARNLHHAASIVCDRHHGQIPEDVETLASLPGIGRSTAGAILALSDGQRQPILDGNVKRVLSRFCGIAGWPGHSRVQHQLWNLAERYTPPHRVAAYTQAMMDLGSLVCTRRRPVCDACPVADHCRAHAISREHDFPTPKPRRQLPVRATCMLLMRTTDGEVLLEQRPTHGIWGGLWSFPECPTGSDIPRWCQQRYGVQVERSQTWATIRHSFSHFHLDITPVRVDVERRPDEIMEADSRVWYNVHHPDARGLAAPVQRLLQTLANDY